MPAGLRSRATLALLTLAAAYAALTSGGDLPIDSNLIVFVVALAALAGVSSVDRQDDGPRDPVLLAALLLPVYILFQLVPLPIALVAVIDPARAEIASALTGIGAEVSWTPLSVSPSATAASMSRVAACVLVFALVRRLGRSAVNRWTLVIPLIVIGAAEAATGLAQTAAGETQAVGTYYSRNHFAGLLEVIFPLALMYGIECVSRRQRRHELAAPDAVKGSVLLTATVVMLAAILLSTSKGGALAAGASLLVMGALRLTRSFAGWQRTAAIGGLAVLLAVGFVLIIPAPLLERFGGLIEEDPTENRYPIWQDTARLFAAYPLFGVGYGNYYTAFFRYQTSGLGYAWTNAHNDHLQLLSELGIIGFALVAVMIGGAFIRAVKEDDDRYVALGCAGAIAAFALHSIAEYNAYVLLNTLALSWVAGLAASVPAAPLFAGQRASVSRLERWPIVTAGGAVVGAWSAAWLIFLGGYNRDPVSEQAFCRFGLCDTDSAFEAWLGEERNTAPRPVPVDALRMHLLRDPASPDRWGFLAEGLHREGRIEEARYCFERSIALSPRAPSALLAAGDFFMAIGEWPRAFALSSRALEAGAIMDDAVFGQLEFREVPAGEVLAHVALDARAARVYLRRIIAAAGAPEADAVKSAGDAEQVWSWIVARGFADDRTAIDHAGFLIRVKRYQEAARAWAGYVGRGGEGGTSEAGINSAAGYPVSNRVFNGGFEADPLGGPFDWRIERRRSGVAASLDKGTRQSGARSLRLEFDGTANVGDAGVEQTVYLEEGRYTLRAYVRTDGVTTDEGVALRLVSVASPRPFDVRTASIGGTSGWTEVEAAFEVPPGGALARLAVVRKPSLKFDNLVRGLAWIDAVRIVTE
jgi:O-antigen ligase